MSRLPDKYEYIKKLGEGSFGSVYKVRKKDGKIIALKSIKIYDEEEIETAKEEIEYLKKLSKPKCNPFVICYYDSFYDKTRKTFFIEMEYVDGISLEKLTDGIYYFIDNYKRVKNMTIDVFIEKLGYEDYKEKFKANGITQFGILSSLDLEILEEVFPSNIAASIMRDVRMINNEDYQYYILLLIIKDLAKGFKYTHSRGIIHNDIKPSNIMIDRKNTPRIVDFGVSCELLLKKNYCESSAGTLNFFPPEITEGDERYPASDMWSLGVTLYFAAKGNLPYNIRSYHALKELEPPKSKTSNTTLNNIANGLLVRKMDDRLTPDQIINMLKDVESLRPN